MNTKFKKGMKTRKAILGANYLNSVKKNITKFDLWSISNLNLEPSAQKRNY